MIRLSLDIGSNSLGSHWNENGSMTTATSIFPAGVDESDEKRGDPKNVERRNSRHTRLTLARRAGRKRALRKKLISVRLLPSDPSGFEKLLNETDAWCLRRDGLDKSLAPHEFGRVLLHLSQRRGALGLKIADDDAEESESQKEDGKVKAAIGAVRDEMKQRKTRTFGEFIALLQDDPDRVVPITTEDKRPQDKRKNPRAFRKAVRNRRGAYEHCADRAMIRDEFNQLWEKQKSFGGELAAILTDSLRADLDGGSAESNGNGSSGKGNRKSIWRQEGLLFGQRRTYWDAGTLGRCDLEPTERCAPQADRFASAYLVVETLNNLKIIEQGKEERALTPAERGKIKEFLSGPLGVVKKGKQKGQPKRNVTHTDLRELMGWGPAGKSTPVRFNVEADEDREINTDWFSRQIIHGVFTPEKWAVTPEAVREGINRAILKCDPEDPDDDARLKNGAMRWGGLSETQADALVLAWRGRPKLDAKRLKMSRRAVRNILSVMDRADPWPDPRRPGQTRWLTQIEARKVIAAAPEFRDVTTGRPLDERARLRYATGAKGQTARDRHYKKKHLLKKNGQPIYGPDGLPLAEPPPAPMISNPVVRKAIHEVRRHLIEYMNTFERKPDEVYIELARQAKMGKKEADEALFRNRLRNRIRKDIVDHFDLLHRSSTQQRIAVDRVVLRQQQNGICPLCGNGNITTRQAADGEGCELAHILPRAGGGHNGLGNLVLAHAECNRNMKRQTPRQFWGTRVNDAMSWIEKMYREISRPKFSEIKTATEDSLWSCYFNRKEDQRKIAQFKKDIKDLQGMTERQDAATKYATRQVMAYLADALFDGEGLPERGGTRRIFATDGMWTSRLRREWGLFFDPHHFRAKGLTGEEEQLRKEKDRGDHRHHAIDAVVIGHCTRDVQIAWEQRELRADAEGIDTADKEAMENYYRQHPLPVPPPFQSRQEFREAVRRAVYGEVGREKPICHRPVKRKLIGALHKATLYGPVIETSVRDGMVERKLVPDRVTIRQEILGETRDDFLKPAHLREPRDETDKEAIKRLAQRYRMVTPGMSQKEASAAARKSVQSGAFTRAKIDPKPEKGGIVRDAGLRRVLRERLEERGLNPDSYSNAELKKSIEKHGHLTMGPLKDGKGTGVPIFGVVLLWANNSPVAIKRWEFDCVTGKAHQSDDPRTVRLYDSQNNHHIEVRRAKNKSGKENWSGKVITAYEAAQRKRAKLRALRKVLCEGGVLTLKAFRKLTKEERLKFRPSFRAAELAHPLVDPKENADGQFVMSLCEGETLFMLHKQTKEPGYFVVAKLSKPQAILLVPHWDARAAGERKDSEGKKVAGSKREEFEVNPSDLKSLAPPGHPHAVKVRVSPLGVVTELLGD